MENQCSLNNLGQCCCNCVYHKPIYHHCSNYDKNHPLRNGGCCCCEIKEWACCVQEGKIFGGWKEHSVGCEIYTPKDGKRKKILHTEK